MKDIAIYGGGGYGSEVACLINAINKIEPVWNLIGFFDDGIEKGTSLPYGKVLGNFQDVNGWPTTLSLVLAIGNAEILSYLAGKISNPNITFPNLIAPSVTFYDRDTVSFGKGNVIFFNSIVSCYTYFGDFNLLNNDVFVGHNTVIGSYNVFNPSVRISGDVKIGDVNFFGVCSIVLQGLNIGSKTKLSAGSCLYRNTKNDFIYAGNPAMVRLAPKK